MPIARIDLVKGKDAAYRAKLGNAVYEAMLSVGVPQNDRFQIITEHDAENFGAGLDKPNKAYLSDGYQSPQKPAF